MQAGILLTSGILIPTLTRDIHIFRQSFKQNTTVVTEQQETLTKLPTKTNLKYLSEHPADWALYFIQTADIDFADADFTSGGDFYNEGAGFIPIGNSITKFAGSYDGGNYIIDNLHISRSTKDNVGLFGYTYNASVQKLGMTNASVIGNEGVGGLMGICESSTNSYCYVSGTVSGLNYVGGMIGLNAESAVSKCYSSGTVSGNYYVGGLLGYNSSTSNVSNSYATSEVSGYSAVGGLVGKKLFCYREQLLQFWCGEWNQ